MAVNGQKLLPQGNRGGALAVSRPKVSLVKKGIKKDITSAPDTMLVIKTRVVEIEKILKGSVVLDKKLQDQERKQREKLLRAEEEKELETKEDKDDKKVKKKKSKIKLGFLDGLIKFINDVLMGWVLVRMIDWLPKLKKIIPILAGALDFITNIVIGAVDILGTFLMWGDKAINGSRNFTRNLFGDTGVKLFDKLISTIGTLFNVISILGLAAAAFSQEWNRQSNDVNNPKKPKFKRKPKSFGDHARRTRRSWQVRAEKMRRKLSRFGRRIRPTNIKRMVQSKLGRFGKKVTNLKQTGSNFLKRAKDSKLLNKLKNINIKEGLNKFGKDYLAHLKKGAGKPGLFANLKTGAGKLWQGTKNIAGKTVEVTKTVAKKTIQLSKSAIKGINNFAKKTLASVNDVIGGIAEKGKKWAKKIGNIIEEAKNPAKLAEKVKKLLKNKMGNILKKNDLIKQLKNLNPKNAAKSIRGLLEGAKKNKHILNLRQGLKAAKAAKIGGVDAVIAAVMGLLDYAAFGESPINAVLRAIGGLLGYTAGFAIGAPFGGVPGFITGMAGAFAGEWASKKIAQGLAGTKLGKIQDPIMDDGRMLVRDPDNAAMNEELEKAQSKRGLGEDKDYTTEGVGKITPIDVNSVTINSISKSASYEESTGGTVVLLDNSSNGTGNSNKNESELVIVGGGNDDGSADALYKGG